jgi:peptide/nickel transport system substrate-binding protein
LCHVTTRDYKTYYTTISSGHIWSDGVPLTIDDIYFTYNDIIKNNKLSIPYLESYSNIEVAMETNKLKVVFENSSEDNTLFFTNYILPKHALIDPNIEMYQQSFAIEPVYNNCAKIKSQSTDQYSLIFSLADCDNTNL